ncbi:sulfotransferase family protein [Thermodesulfatator autotrophicus]|uniref:Sulfotransferase domain-containing protein n=1 Tax=Thermodesulfatator autotrophicus TaxID=1795632 RepID=A0A177E4X6_9BACT|nr:sulfotransferase [Thermodesulfatator autotrophicus]OAG27004.1 hypothetical protein TH606_09255 [Thermodesulfatator autotrophicus]
MLPNFIIIGAMKSGTTSLAKYLSEHPDVFVSDPKEPGFFCEKINWNKGIEWYEELFKNAKGYKAVGEASTHYTKFPEHPRVAEKIKNIIPEVKLIYIMRDPVDRAISHYWHMVHYHNETRPINKAIKLDSLYVWFSRYKYQMEPYLELFRKEQILFLLYDDLVKRPEETVKKCFEFLGVDPDFKPKSLGKAFNPRPKKVAKTNLLLHKIRWSKTWDKISPLVPKSLKDFAKKFEYKKIEPKEELSDKQKKKIRESLKEDIEFMYQVTKK